MSDITWRNDTATLGELVPWERNPKRISKTHAKRLLDYWHKIGQFQTVAIGPNGEVYDGHQRLSVLLAAHGKGYAVDVRRASRALTDEERRELVIAAHVGTTGQFDWDELSGWDASELQAWGMDGELLADWRTDIAGLDAMLKADQPAMEDDPGAQIDKAAELQAKWGTATGQLWQLGEHRLICGDCTDSKVVARVMGGEKADCVFTSPPYAVGVDYGEMYEDTIDSLRAMLPKLAASWLAVVVDGGFAVVNFGDVAPARNIAKVDDPCEYPMAVEYWPVFRSAGWLLWSRRVWCKPTARVNSLWCIQSNRAATDWEHLWTWRKIGEPIIKRVDGEFSSVNGWIDTSRLHGVDEGKDVHGAGMALGIADWMLTIHSRNGAIVHEPFCGTGTTLIACERLGRRCRAVEIEPGYVAVALERWATMTGLEPVLLE